MCQAMRETNQFQKLCGTGRRRAFMLTYVERNLNILLRRQGGDEIESLEDHADLVVAYRGEFALAHSSNIYPVNQNLSAAGIIQSGDDPQQRTFAGARWPNDGDEFSAHDLKTDTFEYIYTLMTQRQAFRNVAHIHDHLVIRLL